ARPTATVSGSASVAPNAPTQIRIDLTGSSPWSLTWSDGNVQSGINASPAFRTVTTDRLKTYSVTSVSDNAGCSGGSTGSATITIAVPAPVSINALTQSNMTVVVQWPAVSGASSYRVERAPTVHGN